LYDNWIFLVVFQQFANEVYYF